MNITAERIQDSQVILTIEVDPERVEKSMDQAYRRNVGRVRVPGFRPGKAPRRIFERHVGREALLQEALDRLVPEIVDEAIKDQDLQMVDQPTLEIPSLDPVVIKATVPIRPTIDLGDYRALRVEPDPVETDEADELEQAIDRLRHQYATIEPVERPAAEGDRVRVNISGRVEDREVLKSEDAELIVTEDKLTSVPGVYEHLLGMSAGDATAVDAVLPDDYRRAELAGKDIHYTLEVLDVKTENLPDLDDDFAKEVGEGFDSMDALRERLTTDIRERTEREAASKLQEKAVEALTAQATIESPPQLTEREIEHMIRDMTRGTGGDDRRAMEQFLLAVGRSEESLRDELRPSAVERVKRTLVLSRLAELEGIEVTESDIEAELDTLARTTTSAAQMRQIFDTPSGREILQRQIRTRRTVERLALIAKGEAPPLDEAAIEAPASNEATPEELALVSNINAPQENGADAEDSAQTAEDQEE
ncbi:MAG: trigger factor [Chloroflexi bacterium]|nr:trigger factor [Chloroflexota bacterium]